MSDLQEIRRFWPWMRECDWFGPRRAFWSRRYRGVQVVVARMDAALWAQAGWAVTFCDDRSRRRSKSDPWDGNQFFTARSHKGSTIAAAMAAAGFAVKPEGKYRETNRLCKVWRGISGEYVTPALVSCQRPRKGVRLGKHGRRLALAASIGEALDATKHWRGK